MQMEMLQSSAVQAHLVLALSGATSLYIAIARPTLSWRKGEPHTSPPPTLYEAGTSPALSPATLGLFRAFMAVYILGMGATQISRLGAFAFKFYTIWNWWLLGIYFALAAVASVECARARAGVESALDPSEADRADTDIPASRDLNAADPGPAATAGNAVTGQWPKPGKEEGQTAVIRGSDRPTPLARACHALFMINSSTVIIVDVVCWGVLYPMLSRGPQSPEIDRIIKRLLLTFTSYNQHGLNAVYIFTDLFLNRHRLAFHAVGPLGLWSLAYALWAHTWHAMTGKWLYPFLDTSKAWAPLAYFGLYMVHWLAFGLVALLYRIKIKVYARREAGAAAAVLVKAKRE